jgi:hypothetical protein
MRHVRFARLHCRAIEKRREILPDSFLCVFHAIADTRFTGSRTAFHGKADTVLR